MKAGRKEIEAITDLMGIPKEAAEVVFKLGQAGDGHNAGDVAFAATFMLSLCYQKANNKDRFIANIGEGILKMAKAMEALTEGDDDEDEEPTLN